MWTYNTDYLSHHGILGQKWGVRRFQNPDGTYTSLGKKRRELNLSDDYKRVQELHKKDVKEMSNQEIQAIINRKNLESQYRKLNPSTVAKGLAYATAFVGAVGTINNVVNKSDRLIRMGQKAITAISNTNIEEVMKNAEKIFKK